ncbi:MAG TPA: DUF5916 domain-containing protein [Vicinamibacterales bacterium]|nr:DUF5916 domain-containing protein [Vicinamibacterales bacterium]
MRRPAAVVAALALLPLSAAAQPPPPAAAPAAARPAPTVRASRTTTPIRLDGRLDEEVYTAMPAITDFVQQEPFEFQPATERTEAWILFDDDYIYVSARNWESAPERRVANEMRRDTAQLRQNDTFAVLFDTFHDRRNGYIFYANAIGGMSDSQVTDEGPPNTDWNTVWDVRTGAFDGGWTIEMAIPFKSLRYQPGASQTWGVNLRRVVRWKNEWSYLAQVPRAQTTFRGILKVSMAGTLEGLQVPSGARNLEVKPYALAGVSTDRTLTPSIDNDADGRVGVDVKYGLTQNITADLTVNTDFAQVEVDEQQVNLTRFNLFFPEKRDFFLEGLGTFAFAGRASAGLAAGTGDTPYLFFSRRIGLDQSREVPLRIGGRATGKAGRVTFGALNVQTGDDEAARIEAANFTVLRAKADVHRRSSIGGMFTHRTATPGRVGSNDGYGVDATIGFSQNTRADAYLAATRNGGRSNDTLSYRGFLDYNADKYGVQVEHLAVEPNFLPEIGFVRRTDMRRNFGSLRYSPRPRSVPHLRRLSFITSGSYITNVQNRLDTRELAGRAETEFTSSDLFVVSYTDSFERLVRPFTLAPGAVVPPGGYDFATTRVSYTGGQQRPVSGEIAVEAGPFYDGDRVAIALNSGRLQVTPQVSLEPSFSINRVSLPRSDVTLKVGRLRATYTITPRMFVSGLVQYNSAAASFGSNVRFRWEYRPGSELFVVYTDDFDTETTGELSSLRNRGFVVKFNRLFRL